MFNGSLPSFDFGAAACWLVLARGLFIGTLFSSYGALLYRVRLAAALVLMPGKSGAVLAARYRRWIVGSLTAACGAACLWLTLQAKALFSAAGFAAVMRALPQTLFSTSFGVLLLLQIICLVAALIAVWSGRDKPSFLNFAAVCIGLAVVLQAGHDHAASMYDGPSLLLLVEIGHLLAGAAWLGSLVPLLLTVQHAPPSAAYAAAKRYSAFGTACVAVLAVTALFQGWQLIGSVPGLLGTAYGWLAIIKSILFAALLGFAAMNRYRLAPRLNRTGGVPAKKELIRSIGIETCFGFAILIAASVLVMLPPSIHEQPVWPFAKMFSLVTVSESPEFFGEVILALFALVVACSLVAAGIYFRRLRWPAIVVAVIIAWFAIPHLDLLLIEAYPTSFYHSPTAFSSVSIVEGARLYPEQCASCHGADGKGDGPAAKGLPEPPADLTAPHLWAHSDGELFWWLTNGIKSPEGAPAMPGFATTLSEEQRWNLIDFIRGHNAGLNYAATGAWSPNILAPAFQAHCQSGTVSSEAFKGKVIRLVFGDVLPAAPVSSTISDRLITVLAGSAGNAPVNETHCRASDPSLVQAYSIVSGISSDQLPGIEFLIDTNGWLRAIQKPGQTIDWNDPGQLEASVIALCAHPLGASSVNHAHHH